MSRSFWDDIQTGGQLDLGSVDVSQNDIVRFASEFDAQPFHTDEEAARATLLGGLSASGWHTCTLIMRLLEEAIARHSGVLEAAGLDDIIWLKPVRPGDVLSGRICWSREATCSCGSGARVRGADIGVRNQHGEVVMQWRMSCLIAPPTDPRREIPQDCPIRKGRAARVLPRPGDHAIKYFEDVAPGDEIELGEYAFTMDRIADFRARYGPGSAHDETIHSGIAYGGRETALAWHVTAVWMHCIVRYYEHQAARLRREAKPVPLLGPAVGVKHLRWHLPVGLGETITFRAWAERKMEISRPDWGLLVVGAVGENRRGDTVVSFYPQMLLERRAGRCCGGASDKPFQYPGN